MFNGVLSTPLRFVSNVSHVVTYLVVCRQTHAMGTEYPVKLQLDRNKAGGKKNLIWVTREKNKPLEYAYAEDNSHSCLGHRRNMISWIEGISFKVSFKTRKKNACASQRKSISSFSHKQTPEVFCKKRCLQKFRKCHRKTPVPEFLF